MITINLKVPLQGVDGQVVPNTSLAKVLSEILGTETEGKTMKLYGWHKTLQVEDPIVVDESDKADLEALIENNKRTYLYIKGQLLSVIKAAK